jgi:hypothetical protein
LRPDTLVAPSQDDAPPPPPPPPLPVCHSLSLSESVCLSVCLTLGAPRPSGAPGRAVGSVCERRSDGSAACTPITGGLSPPVRNKFHYSPGYSLVLSGRSRPGAVPLAVGDSAQFDGLVQRCRGQRCLRRLHGSVSPRSWARGSPTTLLQARAARLD